MSDHIKMHKLDGKWTVRVAGAVLVETSNAVELIEGDYKPAVYFPRDDIAMAFLDKTDTTTTCPYKGKATYYSVITKNGPLQDIGWSYETPIEGMSRIAGHMAFYPHEKLAIEQV